MASFGWLRKIAPRLDKLPGPARMPIPFGNLFPLIKARTKDPVGIFHQFTAWRKEFGPVYRIMAGMRPMVCISDPAIVKQIVKEDPAKYTKGFSYEHLGPWFGRSILMSEGDRWREKRRTMNAAFAAKSLKTFVPKFVETADELVDVWKSREKEPGSAIPVDICSDMTKVTLQVIGKCAFNHDMKTLHGQETRFAQEVNRVLEALANREKDALANFVSVPTFMSYFKDGQQYKKAIDYMKEFADEVVEQRLRESKDRGEDSARDLLDMIIDCVAEDGNIDDPNLREELRDEVLLFFFAGHETTSTLLSWAIFHVANNPEIYEKVMQELDEHVPQEGVPTYEQLNKLEYMTCVLKETLRLYSPAAGFIREPIDDVELDGHVVPAKVPLFILSYTIHRDEQYWTDPEKFDPERFLPKNSKGRPVFAWLPFAVGPRNCIGMQFAMLEARAILTRILRGVQVKAITEPTLDSLMLLKPTPYEATVTVRR
eukprot:TRINITY_DN3422_c2_g1_i1.p1 TRINITY_DN3422_c2_g1~~TRINITY_DN3422_c2_g1_i1.p1  ORF type:complete len:504 (-),score=123.52 TRINITY_DN3422_c2_g1_i1:372-1826(-)